MQTAQLDIVTFTQEHLDGALSLSQQAGWPHRRDDWALVLSLSQGVVAIAEDRIVGTALTTLYGDRCAAINLVIVDEALRGRGLGRDLMLRALGNAGQRQCRLVATTEGLPLYRKLGFEATGDIVQTQGIVPAGIAPPDCASIIDQPDLDQLVALDAEAFGVAREPLLAQIAGSGRIAMAFAAGRPNGFAIIRPFGKGEVIGPVVAPTRHMAQALIQAFLATRGGSFLRVDCPVDTELAPWLSAGGLAAVGGGIAMVRPGADGTPPASRAVRTFALASQALG